MSAELIEVYLIVSYCPDSPSSLFTWRWQALQDNNVSAFYYDIIREDNLCPYGDGICDSGR